MLTRKRHICKIGLDKRNWNFVEWRHCDHLKLKGRIKKAPPVITIRVRMLLCNFIILNLLIFKGNWPVCLVLEMISCHDVLHWQNGTNKINDQCIISLVVSFFKNPGLFTIEHNLKYLIALYNHNFKTFLTERNFIKHIIVILSSVLRKCLFYICLDFSLLL